MNSWDSLKPLGSDFFPFFGFDRGLFLCLKINKSSYPNDKNESLLRFKECIIY